MGLTGKIFLGLIAGICTGLFFGELVAELKIVGDIFVKMLQITVLPYIVVSLIAGIGRMQIGQARRLAVRGTAVLVLIWGLALVLIFVAALAFPDLDSASFFSHAAVPEPQPVNLVDLYVPANVFHSLSNNMVPAVVLFSILVGVALISVEDNASVLAIFDGLGEALTRINGAIIQLTPYGIFAIAAAAAGTMTIEELARVQVYLVTYVALALMTTFWIFPGLVAALSGIPFREVLGIFRDALVTAFATGNQFVVLPQIAENCKELLRRHHLDDAETNSAIDIIVPVSFNFPSLGKLLVLLFVLFAAWFNDLDLSALDALALAFNGLFSLFGSINIAVPYLLDALRIPADMFQLFLVTGIVVGRFGAMLAALHIIVISVIGTLALSGKINFDARSLLRYTAVSAVLLLGLVAGLRSYFMFFVPEPPSRAAVLSGIQLLEERVSARISTRLPDEDPGRLPDGRLQHIVDSGMLQVGYRPANLPCTFITPAGKLVGFDVEMAHMLAEDLDVDLEFVPFVFERLDRMLDSGQIDIAMSCVASLPDRYAKASFSRSYLDLTMALVVRDHSRSEFSDIVQLQRRQENLTLAVVGNTYFARKLRRLLPGATLRVLESAEAFFAYAEGELDALLISAEEGAAYTYRYPRYSVVEIEGGSVRVPAAYAIPRDDARMREFVSNWVDLKRKEGAVESLYAYWMLGGAAQRHAPRWSVIRDVLGWID